MLSESLRRSFERGNLESKYGILYHIPPWEHSFLSHVEHIWVAIKLQIALMIHRDLREAYRCECCPRWWEWVCSQCYKEKR